MKWLGFVLTAGFVATGCGGHVLMSGSVVKTESPNDARVCLVNGHVNVGDSVRVIHHTCEHDPGREAVVHCSRTVVGTAEVMEIIDGHYLIVHSAPEVPIHDGDTVEPISH